MAKEKATSTALVTADQSPYSVVSRPDADQLLRGALIDGGVGMFQLTQLRLPSGGGMAWTVDTLEGPTAIAGKDMEVIIGGMRAGLKKWWRSAFGEGESGPPNCQSVDGMTGYGVNSLEDGLATQHDCITCPWNKFGSARKGGNGKDCSDFMVAMVFREGCSLPDVLNIPASSLKTWQSYIVKLTNAGKSPWAVVTRLAMETKSEGALKWSILTPQYVRDLSPEESARFAASREVLTSVIVKNFSNPAI